MAKKEVIKHSSAIQISNEISRLQRVSWNVLLANAYDDLIEEDIYNIKLKDLIETINYKSKNEQHLKELVRSLIDIKVEWNILNKDGHNEWGVLALLAEVKIINGVLYYGYAPSLRKMLYSPSMYARINLSLQNQFESKHSLALYEICIDYLDFERGKGETPYMKLDKFKKLLGLNNDEYSQYKDLNYYIIKKALREINKISDIEVSYLTKKQGRNVVALKFKIKKKTENKTGLLPKKIKKMNTQGHLFRENELSNQVLYNSLIKEFNLSQIEACDLLEKIDEFQIYENLDYVRSFDKAGKIQSSIRGFTVKAIQNNYQLSQKEKDQQEQRETQAEKKNKQKELQVLQNTFQTERIKKINQKIKKFLPDQKQEEEKAFAEYMKNRSSFDSQRFKEKGVAGLQFDYQIFIGNRHLSESENDFILWVKKHHNLTVIKNSGTNEFEFQIKSTK